VNNILTFEGQEVIVKTDKGEKLINLVSTARSCGLVNRTRGFESVRWSQVKERLTIVRKAIGKDVPTKYFEEIQYILNEIENADDRNSIYMSSWLSKRLALECHSEKAMRYKNFLVELDEKREQGLIAPQSNELMNIVGQVVQNLIPTLTKEMATNLVPVVYEAKEQVNKIAVMLHDQSIIYDQEREDLKALIGIRSVNTKRLVEKLKEKLSDSHGTSVNASMHSFQRAKAKVFKKFKVTKWEDIPAVKYNEVYAFIDEMEIEN
jgi:hypothetical protein